MTFNFRWPLLLGLCAVLTACIEPSTTIRPERGSSTRIDRTRPAHSIPDHQRYTVQAGDTLFRIAFRYQTTVDELVRWNHIVDRNRIQVGQQLRVSPEASSYASAPNRSAPTVSTTAVVAPAQTSASPANHGVPADALPQPSTPVEHVDPNTGVVTAGVGEDGRSNGIRPTTTVSSPAPVVSAASAPAVSSSNVATPSTSSPAIVDPEATLASPPTAVEVPPAGSAGKPALTQVAAPTAVRNGWTWPVAGKLVGTFVSGDATRSGIDIAGTEGQAVYAAADGEVLFSGTGIIGYGELIVIQHPNGLLSAYGHSRRRLVSEGAKIKRGQQIAELGRDASGRQLLHFEVRKAGKPVDPLAYLPGR